ncbi:MAG: endonuclease/exonuclease/phosphatase family protein, partial [Microbacterium sp.]|nr:endonuclease/exonuclease/phosphatase family protein [Microbacterium sp.]
MRRLVGILAAVLCAVAAAVLTWPPFFHLERTYPIAQIVSFRSLMVVGFGVVLVLALLLAIARPLRGFAAALAIIALVAGVANAGILFSRGMGSDTLPAKGADSIRVMTWNTAGAATSPDDIARTAVAMDADIVTLPETTIATGEQVALAMRALGHRMWAYHTQYGAHGWDASSTTLLISPRLGTYSVIESSADGTSNTSTVPSAVAMPTSGSGPVIVAAHAVAPRQEYMQRWRHDLQWIADQCAAKDVILAGDFNATVDHMSGFGVDGGTMGRCHDAVGATGNGAVGTWPTSLPAWAGAPIDHVMATSDWKATGSV